MGQASIDQQASVFTKAMDIEWIADTQLIVGLKSVMHILGVQCFRSGKNSGSNDHPIVHV
jgi:hypothetical protein